MIYKKRTKTSASEAYLAALYADNASDKNPFLTRDENGGGGSVNNFTNIFQNATGTTFTLTKIPKYTYLMTVDGIPQAESIDYSLVGSQITLVNTLIGTDHIIMFKGIY